MAYDKVVDSARLDATFTSIATPIKAIFDLTEKITPEQMGTYATEANEEISQQSDLVSQIKDALIGKAAGGSVANVTPPTPTIEVSSAGKITATVVNPKGYQEAETTKTATKQLTTKGAATITPGTADQTIPSGRYLTGTQTIKGDANLVPENIPVGTTLFGVEGTKELGTDTSGATAAAENIEEGYTAWVNGGLVTGSVKKTGGINIIDNLNGTSTISTHIYIGGHFADNQYSKIIAKTGSNGNSASVKITAEQIASLYSRLSTASAAMVTAYQEGVDSV